MYNFEFVRPSSVADAVAALADEDAMALGGGQTLLPTMKARLAAPTKLVSLSGIDGLSYVKTGGDSVVLATGGTIVTDKREIAAEDFFQGMFATALEAGEIITAVRFPVPQAAHYEKFAQPASRFPLVGIFVARFASGVRVAVTGASESGVFRWTEAETALSSDFSADVVEGLTPSADGLIGDLHGTPTYRANMIRVMTARAVAAAG